MTVVRVREQGALGWTISSAADPQPTFAAEFCCVLSREGVPFSPRQLLAKIRAFLTQSEHRSRNSAIVPSRSMVTALCGSIEMDAVKLRCTIRRGVLLHSYSEHHPSAMNVLADQEVLYRALGVQRFT